MPRRCCQRFACAAWLACLLVATSAPAQEPAEAVPAPDASWPGGVLTRNFGPAFDVAPPRGRPRLPADGFLPPGVPATGDEGADEFAVEEALAGPALETRMYDVGYLLGGVPPWGWRSRYTYPYRYYPLPYGYAPFAYRLPYGLPAWNFGPRGYPSYYYGYGTYGIPWFSPPYWSSPYGAYVVPPGNPYGGSYYW